MHSNVVQLRKEARQILMPAAMIWGAIALAVMQPHFNRVPVLSAATEAIVYIAIHFGVAIAASMPFGEEMHSRTLNVLLTQPIERSTLWAKKFLVAAVAILPPAALYLAGCKWGWIQDVEPVWLTTLWMMAFVSGAVLWTMIARTTLGGVVLSCGFNYVIFATFSVLVDRYPRMAHPSLSMQRAGLVAFGCYCVLAVWLGRRMFIAYQDDRGLEKSGARSYSDWASFKTFGAMRFRPDQPLWNLVRRELRLLGPVWPLAALTLIPTLGLMLRRNLTNDDEIFIGISIGSIYIICTVVAVLAGALGIGEERSSGTHQWHLTLPISVTRQWLLKLFISLMTSVVFAGALPSLELWLSSVVSGQHFLDPGMVAEWCAAAAGITLIAFWCSTVTSGTVKAALLVFPLAIGLCLTVPIAEWTIKSIGTGKLFKALVSRVDPFQLTTYATKLAVEHVLILWCTPVALFLIWNSYRLFARQSGEPGATMARQVIRVVIVAMIVSFATSAVASLWLYAYVEAWYGTQDVFRETHEAIENYPPAEKSASLKDGRTIAVQAEDLVKDSSISPRTRDWLRHSILQITMRTSDMPAKDRTFVYTTIRSQRPHFDYIATLHDSKGRRCEIYFTNVEQRDVGVIAGKCE